MDLVASGAFRAGEAKKYNVAESFLSGQRGESAAIGMELSGASDLRR